MDPQRSEYWIVHDGQRICSASEKAAALFRGQMTDLIGQDLFDLIPSPEMRALARLRMSHIVSRGELHDQELPLRRFDGSVFWANVHTYRLGLDTFISTLVYIGDHNQRYKGT